MKKLIGGIFLTCGLIVVLAVSFIFYGQFALDYSLENLREALTSAQGRDALSVGRRVYGTSLDSMVIDEITRKDANLETVVLLEHTARSVRAAVQRSGYTEAGVYLAEILKEKSPHRNLLLRATDSVYHLFKNLIQSFQNLWKYLARRLGMIPEMKPLAETAVLILDEAEKSEKSWKLEETERYYREFLDRFSDRPERGFVRISLANVLTKMRRLKEATEILEKVEREFQGGREETLAASLLERIGAIQKRLNRIPELENWIKALPERIFLEEGGLELALSYLATYQVDRALDLLKTLSEATDPRIRAKSLFYRAWIHKWQGDLDEGKVLFQMLEKEPHLEEKLALVATAEMAQVHYEKKEYQQAVDLYEKLSRKAAGEAWKALSELEQSSIYLFGLGNAELASRQLDHLEKIFPRGSADYELTRKRFEEILDRNLRDQGFGALSLGRLEVAAKIFEDYLKKYPREGSVHSALASIFLIRGSLQKALGEAQKGFKLERSEYTATVLGYVYEKMERLPEAERHYNIAIQIQPFYLTARFNLAWIYVKTEKFKEADSMLVELEKEKSGFSPITQAKILNNRGCALWALGRTEEAMARFQEALRILPDFPEAKNNINLAIGEKPVAAVI